jgi:hypothetical protein
MARQEVGRVVFRARKPPPASVPHEFALLESSYGDDDLVYAVPEEISSLDPGCMTAGSATSAIPLAARCGPLGRASPASQRAQFPCH